MAGAPPSPAPPGRMSLMGDMISAEDGKHLIRMSLPDNQGTVVCVEGTVTLIEALKPALARRRLTASDYMPCFFGTTQKAGWQTPVASLPSFHIVLATVPRHAYGSIRKKINWTDDGYSTTSSLPSSVDGSDAGSAGGSSRRGKGATSSRGTSHVAAAAIFEQMGESDAPTTVSTGTTPPSSGVAAAEPAVSGGADVPAQQQTPTAAAIDKRTRIVNELVATERAFVKSMDHLVESYYYPLKSTRGIILMEDVETIFCNVEELVEGNRQLLLRLEAVVSTWDSAATRVGHLFMSMAPFFSLYERYCNNHAAATAAVLRCQEKEPFLIFLKDVQRAAAASQARGDTASGVVHQSIDSLLLMPVQRVPRYILMLQELLKHTPDTHPDSSDIAAALEEVKRLAESLNENVRRSENEAYVTAIDRAFPGEPLALTTSPPLSSIPPAAPPSSTQLNQQMRSNRTMSDSAAAIVSAREAAQRVRQGRASTLYETTSPSSGLGMIQRSDSLGSASQLPGTVGAGAALGGVAGKLGRRFIMEGMLRVSGDEGAVRERYVFLLSDQLIIAKPRSASNVSVDKGAQFSVKARVALHEAWVIGADDFGDAESFMLGWAGRVTYFGVGSQAERDTWLEAVAGRIAAEKKADPSGKGPLTVYREESAAAQAGDAAIRGFSLSKGFYATTADDVNAVIKTALDKFGIVGDPAWYGLWEVYEPPNGYQRSRLLLPFECPLILRYALVAMGRHEHTRLVMREYDVAAHARSDLQRHLIKEQRPATGGGIMRSNSVATRSSAGTVRPLLVGTLNAGWTSAGSRSNIFSAEFAPPSRLSGGTLSSFARSKSKRQTTRITSRGSSTSIRGVDKLYSGRGADALVMCVPVVDVSSSPRPSVVAMAPPRLSDASTSSGLGSGSLSSLTPSEAMGEMKMTLAPPLRDMLQRLYDAGVGRKGLFKGSANGRLGMDLLDAYDAGLNVEIAEVPVSVVAAMLMELLSKVPETLVPAKLWASSALLLVAIAKGRATWGGGGGVYGGGGGASAGGSAAFSAVQPIVESLPEANRFVLGCIAGVLSRLCSPGSEGLSPEQSAERLAPTLVATPSPDAPEMVSPDAGSSRQLSTAELGLAASLLIECMIVDVVRLFGADKLDGPRRVSSQLSQQSSVRDVTDSPASSPLPVIVAQSSLTAPTTPTPGGSSRSVSPSPLGRGAARDRPVSPSPLSTGASSIPTATAASACPVSPSASRRPISSSALESPGVSASPMATAIARERSVSPAPLSFVASSTAGGVAECAADSCHAFPPVPAFTAFSPEPPEAERVHEDVLSHASHFVFDASLLGELRETSI